MEIGLQQPNLMMGLEGEQMMHQQWGLQMPTLQPMDMQNAGLAGNPGITAYQMPQQHFQFFASYDEPPIATPVEPEEQKKEEPAAETCEESDEQGAEVKTREAKVRKSKEKPWCMMCN